MPDAEANKSLIRTAFEEIWNRGNWDLAPERYHRDIVVHTPTEPEPIRGLDGFRRHWGELRATFPDLTMAVQEIFADGDKVAVRFTVTGTNTGPLDGMKPTGKRVRFDEAAFFRFEEGLVKEAWFAFDSMEMGRQLGIAPDGPPPLIFVKAMGLLSRFMPKPPAK